MVITKPPNLAAAAPGAAAAVPKLVRLTIKAAKPAKAGATVVVPHPPVALALTVAVMALATTPAKKMVSALAAETICHGS